MMSRRSPLLSGLLLSGLLCFCAASFANAAAMRVRVAGDVPKAVLTATPLGRMDETTNITVALSLPLRNSDKLDSLLQSLYDPTSADYGHYLTPDQFTAQFGPTQSDYDAVADYARLSGLAVTQTHPNRLLLDVTGPVIAVESAFGVHLYQYKGSAGRVFHVPDSAPSVPAAIASRITGVVGLSDAAVRHSHIQRRSDLLYPNTDSPLFGTGPEDGLSPANFKTAYDLSGSSLTGSGQTAAVYELDGYKASDIAGYESKFSLPSVTLQNILVDGVNGNAGDNESEVVLDIEVLLGMAPGITKLLVYETGQSDQENLDGYNRIATDDIAKEISTSWGLDEQENDSSFLQSENTIFKEYAAQGQSIFAAGGDNGAYDSGSENDGLRVDDPASQPYVCGVGGTTLSTNGAGGTWEAETTWNSGSVSVGAGGGGHSYIWSIPSWQTGYVSSASLGSTSYRNVPDISINADPQNGYSIYLDGSWTVYGGTSAGAPLLAGFTALINQQRVTEGRAVIGFINPSLYPILSTTAYATDFHDIKDGSTNLYYPAVAGYDDATGIGTPIGANLIATLAPSTTTTQVPSAPSDLTATAGNAKITLSWSSVSTATSYNLYRSTASGSGYVKLATVTSASYVDTGVSNGTTYYYVVTAVNSAGASAGSNTAYATPAATTPAAPTNLTAVAGNTKITLSWTASSGATSYNLYSSTSMSSGYAKLVTTTSTSYTDSGLTNGITYYYVVTAVSGGLASVGSNNVAATPYVYVPPAPTNLIATAGPSRAVLTWTDATAGLSYNLYRSNSPSSGFAKVTTTTAHTYTDAGLNNGSTFYYVVTAVYNNQASSASNTASVTPTSVPPTPTSLTAAAGNTKITLSWGVGASGANYSLTFNLYRSTNSNSGFVKVVTTSGTSYVDSSLTNGITYYYVVTAVSGGVASSGSNTASAAPNASIPDSPTSLTATGGNSLVTLSWVDATAGLSFNLYRSTSATSGYVKVTTTSAKTFTDTDLANGTTYYYVVTAVSNGVASPGSNTASATPST